MSQFLSNLMSFLTASPTPFHAVENMVRELDENGFTCLNEADAWSDQVTSKGRPGNYYVMRNDSSLCVFRLTGHSLSKTGLRLMGTHTDSPCLKVKPNAEMVNNGYLQLAVEVYGGVLLNPWFDRDLSIAGRVSFEGGDGGIKSRLINFSVPIAIIPSLAIHLDRDVHVSKSINAQTDILPLILQEGAATFDIKRLLAQQIIKEYPDVLVKTVYDYELSLFDTQPPALIGLNKEFIAAARLDNLLSCYVAMQSILDSTDQPALLICNDHEEVGSNSIAGAQGTFLESILKRLVSSEEQYSQMISRSMLVSLDNAHGVHPNFSTKHDDQHGPLLNKGPVIKVNNNQRYATNSITSAIFRQCCTRSEVPVQVFVTRNDMGCGSTIGPITATRLGVKTLDVGMPTFAMHSIRETAGSNDGHYTYLALKEFLGIENL